MQRGACWSTKPTTPRKNGCAAAGRCRCSTYAYRPRRERLLTTSRPRHGSYSPHDLARAAYTNVPKALPFDNNGGKGGGTKRNKNTTPVARHHRAHSNTVIRKRIPHVGQRTPRGTSRKNITYMSAAKYRLNSMDHSLEETRADGHAPRASQLTYKTLLCSFRCVLCPRSPASGWTRVLPRGLRSTTAPPSAGNRVRLPHTSPDQPAASPASHRLPPPSPPSLRPYWPACTPALYSPPASPVCYCSHPLEETRGVRVRTAALPPNRVPCSARFISPRHPPTNGSRTNTSPVTQTNHKSPPPLPPNLQRHQLLCRARPRPLHAPTIQDPAPIQQQPAALQQRPKG